MSILLDTFLNAECSKTEQLFFQTQLICAFFFLSHAVKSKSTVPYTRSPRVKPPSTVSYKAFQKLTVVILRPVYRPPFTLPLSLRLLQGLLCALPVFTWQSFLTSISLFFSKSYNSFNYLI